MRLRACIDPMTISPKDYKDLQYAVDLLEHPGFAARLTDLVGRPIESGFRQLPAAANAVVETATNKALTTAMQLALSTLDRQRSGASRDRLHKLMVVGTGAGGGAFGLPALAVELPLTTTVMLRSIADIARSEGEALDEPLSQLACLEVFALGGRGKNDDGTESGYFMVRAALARSVSEAARYAAQKGVAGEAAPALVRLVSQVASRFGIVASEKVAAQAVPVIGALGGAFINSIFIDHFQDMARGHFIVRRLERSYTPGEIQKAYVQLRDA